LLNVLDQVTKRGAGFKSIADPMIDTTSPHGKLILAALAALAEFERSMTLARCEVRKETGVDCTLGVTVFARSRPGQRRLANSKGKRQ